MCFFIFCLLKIRFNLPNFRLQFFPCKCNLSISSCSSLNFPRRSLVILSLIFLFKAFSYGIWLFCVLGQKDWQQNFHLLWLASVVSIRSPWGIFVQLFREAFSQPHRTDNDETSIPIAFNHLLIVPAQWLFFNSCFLAPDLAEAGKKKIFWCGFQWTALLIPC